MLDHSGHCERVTVVSTKGEQVYHQKYVTPLKTVKKFKYIPELIQAVFEEWKAYISSMKCCCATLSENHPINIQHTIAYLEPGNTIDIVKNKKSRSSE